MKPFLIFLAVCLFALPALAFYEPAQILYEHSPPLPNESWRDVLVASSGGSLWVVRPGRSVELYARSLESSALIKKREWPLPPLEQDAALSVAAAADMFWLIDRKSRQAWSIGEDQWREPIQLSDAITGIAALADGLVVVNTPRHSQHAFAVVDRNGKVLRRFGQREIPKSSLLVPAANTWLLAVVGGNDVIAAHAHRPLLRRYRATGELVWERRVDLPSIERLEAQRQQVEAVIEVDPTTCCIETKMVHFATAVTPVGAWFGVRFGLERTVDFFDGSGAWKSSVAIDAPPAPQGWLTAGLTFVHDRFVAAELKRVVAYATLQGEAIEGRVTDTEGRAVRNARIVARTEGGGNNTVVTDAEGRFRIAAIAPKNAGRISITAADFLPLEASGVFEEILARPLVLERQPEQCVVVRARETGEPVPAFRLSVGELKRSESSVRRSDGVAREISSADGRGCVRVPFAPPIFARVSAEGFATAEVELAAAGTTEVTLDKEVPLTVHVQTGGEAVGGARVSLLPPAMGNQSTGATASDVTNTSDEDGTAVLHGFGPGEYVLVVEHDDFVRWERKTRLEEAEEIDVELDRGGRIGVRVTAASSGQPLADSVIHAEPRGPAVQRPLSCRTGADGSCVIGGIPDGRYILKVEHAQHARAHETIAVGPPDHRVHAAITLSDATTITGRVRGVNAYSGVRLDVLLGKPGVTPVSAPVGPDGEFSASEAPTGLVNVWVVERDVDSTLLHQRVSVPAGGTYRIDMSLPSPLRLRGRIRTASAIGCGGCAMTLQWQGGELGTPNRTAQVRGDGSFQALLPVAGPYRVTIEDRSSGARLVERIDVRGDMDRDFHLGDGSLRITTRLEDGTAATSALITVDADGQTLAERTADSNGVVRFTALPRRVVRVIATSNGRSATAEVDLSGDPDPALALTILTHEPLRLRVIDAGSGLPVPRVSVRSINSAHESLVLRNLSAAADGSIPVPSPGGGPLTIVVSAPGYALRTLHDVPQLVEPLTVLLVPGPRAFTVEVDPKLAPCALEVRGRDDRPLALSFETLPGPVPFTMHSAMFSWMQWGSYQVLLHDCGGGTLRKSLELSPATERHVRFP